MADKTNGDKKKLKLDSKLIVAKVIAFAVFLVVMLLLFTEVVSMTIYGVPYISLKLIDRFKPVNDINCASNIEELVKKSLILLNDKNTQERINRIKLYQQFGFTIKEITWLIDAPVDELKNALEKQVEKMKEERKEMDALIEEAQRLIDTM